MEAMPAPHSPHKKGSILLIHGSAPFNEEGNVPDARAGRYVRTNFFGDLARELERRGWTALRYSKPGVFHDHIDFGIYKTTDVTVLGNQLRTIWRTLPKDGPRLVFAWSEGSLHVGTLPMGEIDGVVLLGAISTNIRDVILAQAGNRKAEVESQLQKMTRLPKDEMLGLDRPAGRLQDELEMADNWKAFESLRRDVPLLILHGEADTEVPVNQADLWKDKLPNRSIDLVVAQGKNHMLSDGDSHGAALIAESIDRWWLRKAPRA